MSTPTDVVPEAGWYRDPAAPGVARWWDGTSWGSQTQAVPTEPALPAAPAPQAAPAAHVGAAEAAPLIGVAATTLTPEPAGSPDKQRKKLSVPSLSLRSVKLSGIGPPRKPILIGVAAVVLLGVGWYAWSSMHSSSDAAPVTASPGGVAPAVNTASLHLPKVLPAKLAGQLRQTRAVSVSAAKGIAAAQRPATRIHLAAYYGPSVANRFLFVGSTLTAASAKPASAALERAHLVALLNAETGGSVKAAKVRLVAVPAGPSAGGGVLSCVTAASHGKPASVCSWQNATTRLTVVTHTPMLGAATTLRSALVQLAG